MLLGQALRASNTMDFVRTVISEALHNASRI
jgi:hypothetical protein